MTQNQEQDIRLQMLNSFLSCPHRDTDQIKRIHSELQSKDPVFYAHLASWYRKNGDIRDHMEVFASMLIIDSYHENREVGLAIFQQVPTFMKTRVLGFIKGKKVKIRHKTGRKKKIKGGKTIDDVNIEEKMVGLYKNPPTAFKREIKQYLRYLEADNKRFDSVAVRNARDLKTLYASMRIRPSRRANDILFHKKYPKDSGLNVFEEILNAKSSKKIARLIVENKVPYTTAVGLIEKITPSILVALINNMSPQELMNNLASLEERGALNNKQTRELIESKIEKVKKSKNVSALKGKQAKKTGRIKDASVSSKIDEVSDEQVKKRGTVKLPTAIFVDRSGSMRTAIEMGKSCAALVSGATEAPLYVIAFDSMPMEIQAKGNKTYSDWERAFIPVRPGGSTSIGCPLKALGDSNVYVEQIVIITDGGENAHPTFVSEYSRYANKMSVRPNVVIIRVGNWYEQFASNLKRSGIDTEIYTPQGTDYYGLPGLVQILSRKSKLDLLMEIMNTPLVHRKKYSNVAPDPKYKNDVSRKVLV